MTGAKMSMWSCRCFKHLGSTKGTINDAFDIVGPPLRVPRVLPLRLDKLSKSFIFHLAEWSVLEESLVGLGGI
ncbi:hypothetical protein DFA_12354 [Cavenderia fasciculata]|uniref:Uncharacterized protein n=1 Tax=Cavenderia fasciculata TaxID=261658 RepID=F4QDF9_CACFS|nr:uncharacterized protein DFA_12354 [Cavenderia fasciculata]EGG14577.1 hypothetical protein DFA_12354 [Cavenderia fasciculata]|eukprot:XP_004366097.1 hypothetical protein DFA_12354 [Cavenderia fasciculata]